VSATLSLALVETLVHIPSGLLPSFTAIPIDFDDAAVEILDAKAVPADWRTHPPPRSTQSIGDAWVASGRSAILRVPSVVVPAEFNYLLNPRHRRFPRSGIGAPLPFPFDPRLRR
jgi:RES domain-containing protein